MSLCLSQSTTYHVKHKVVLITNPVNLQPPLNNDLAILKVNAMLTPAPLGDSDLVEAGDGVLAVGNPISDSLAGTVSDGIISGLRELGGRKFIQMTAPISPGNSGGGLFTLDGKLVGVPTLIYTNGQALNFAVPINLAKPLLADAATASAIPLSGLPKSNSTTQQDTGSRIIAALRNMRSECTTPYGPVRFNYAEHASKSFDIAIYAVIDAATYSSWKQVGQDFRNQLVKEIADVINENSSGKSFSLSLFYLSNSSTYPQGYSSNEISLNADGSWRITHMIGRSYTKDDHIYWTSWP